MNLPCKDCKLYKLCTKSTELRDGLILGEIECGDYTPLNIIRADLKFPYEVYPVTGIDNYQNILEHNKAKAEALKKSKELNNAQSSKRDKEEELALPLKARLNEFRTSTLQLLQLLELLIEDE